MTKLGICATIVSFLFPFLSVPPLYAATRYKMGISTSATLLWMNEEDIDDRLYDIKKLGASWIRVDFSWSAIQPDNPREYNWDMYDRVVDAADRHDLKILAVLGYTPKWAQEPHCRAILSEEVAQKCNPRSSGEFGRFARAAALRYHDKSVRGWEIWNEPNLTGYWKTMQPDGTLFVSPKVYARLANTAAREIRRYSDAIIITGGLAPLFEPSRSTGMRQSDYLAQMLPNLTPKLFDGVGIHPYTWPILPRKAAPYNAFYTVNNGRPEYNLRSVMGAAGWDKKQVWGTEYGASTKGVRSVSRPTKHNRPDHVSEHTQARIIAQGVADWYVKPNVGPLFVHSDSDQWLAERKNEGGFGVRRSDGTKKPAYDVLRKTTQRLLQK